MKLGFPMLLALLLPLGAVAADVPSFTLTLQNHRYVPDELRIPANTRVKLVIVNKDPSPEEFESNDFPAEKIVMPNSSISVFVGPLKPGHYGFYGDFHQPTAKGTLIAE
ncbi:MAG: cupredoxin domain-containing protein [Rhodanobacter sp.]